MTVKIRDRSIAELADASGVTRRTIRYYVAEGLLPAPSGKGQLQGYNYEHLARVRLILKLKQGYLPLRAIRERIAHLSLRQVEELLDDQEIAVRETGSEYHPLAVRSEERVPYGDWPQPSTETQEDLFGESGAWHRKQLGAGVELSYQSTDDPVRRSAIQRLVEEAGKILGVHDGSPDQQ